MSCNVCSPEAQIEGSRKKRGREGTVWKEQSKSIKTNLGLSADNMEFTSRPGRQLRGVNKYSERVKDLINCGYSAAVAEGVPEKDIIIDCAMSHKWALNKLNGFRTLTRASEAYLVEHDAVLVAEEWGALMGFYHESLASATKETNGTCSDVDLKRLYSKSMHIGQMAMILSAMLSQIDLGSG